MQDIVNRDISSALKQLRGILETKEKDTLEIKELSNRITTSASIFQDENFISVAVLIYSLSKIMERKRDIDYKKIVKILEECQFQLNKNDADGFKNSITEFSKFLRSIDRKLSLYVQEVINHSQIKKGCRLCESGISVARASDILGISQWELMSYLGKTTIADAYPVPINIKSRMKFARELFR